MMRESIDNVNHKGGHPGEGRGKEGPEPDVLELIHQVMHRYRARQYRVLRDGPHDITHMDSRVLGFFDRHPGATQSDLATHSGRDKAQLARLVKGLRERGLLHGEADAQDRRNLRMTLTAEGKAVQRTLQQAARRLSAQAVTGLDEAQRAQLAQMLRQVNANLGPD